MAELMNGAAGVRDDLGYSPADVRAVHALQRTRPGGMHLVGAGSGARRETTVTRALRCIMRAGRTAVRGAVDPISIALGIGAVLIIVGIVVALSAPVRQLVVDLRVDGQMNTLLSAAQKQMGSGNAKDLKYRRLLSALPEDLVQLSDDAASAGRLYAEISGVKVFVCPGSKAISTTRGTFNAGGTVDIAAGECVDNVATGVASVHSGVGLVGGEDDATIEKGKDTHFYVYFDGFDDRLCRSLESYDKFQVVSQKVNTVDYSLWIGTATHKSYFDRNASTDAAVAGNGFTSAACDTTAATGMALGFKVE